MYKTIERTLAAHPNTDSFYKIIGDSRDWANYFTPEEYEEMTDVAERLRAPMDHAIIFHGKDGKLYCGTSTTGDDLLTISKNAELTAQEMTRVSPAWAVETLRRNIETREIIQATNLPYGAQMLIFSPTPDDVLSGAINIGGYNLEKKTTMVRVWTHDEEGLGCRYISLDGGNKKALIAAARAVGREILPQDTSEEILATFYSFPNGIDNLAECVVDGYDEEMKRQTGRDHSYGRPGLNHKKALEIAYENPARLHEHMSTIRALRWQYSGEKLAQELEKARYDYAAALDKITRCDSTGGGGDGGGGIISNRAAGNEARGSGANFSGYCAGSSVNANNWSASSSTQHAYNSMFGRKNVKGKCPCCGETTTYDPCSPKCGECGSTPGYNRSREYLANKKKEAAEVKIAERAVHGHNKSKLLEKYERQFGTEILNNIKKFVWGDGAFDGVAGAVDYYGRTIAIGQDAKELYETKYNLN